MQTSSTVRRPFYRRPRLLLSLVFIVLILIYMGMAYIAYDSLSHGTRTFAPRNPAGQFTDISFPPRGRSYPVRAFYMPGKPDAPALISVHGYNMSRYSDYHMSRANGLRDLGYTVLSIDLSDGGGSTIQNGRISMGDSERYEVLGAYDYLLSQGFTPDNIGIVSESMGAATSLMAAYMEPRIKAVWADSPFEDAGAVFGERIGLAGFPPFLAYGGMLWGYIIGGEKIWEVRPIDAGRSLADHHQAVYLVATTEDDVVPLHHGLDLNDAFTKAGVDVTFWEVPGLNHAQTQTTYFDEYMRRIDAFFKSHLGSRAA